MMNKTVNYDSKRGGISVMVERGATTLSSLLIQKAARRGTENLLINISVFLKSKYYIVV